MIAVIFSGVMLIPMENPREFPVGTDDVRDTAGEGEEAEALTEEGEVGAEDDIGDVGGVDRVAGKGGNDGARLWGEEAEDEEVGDGVVVVLVSCVTVSIVLGDILVGDDVPVGVVEAVDDDDEDVAGIVICVMLVVGVKRLLIVAGIVLPSPRGEC